MKTLTDLKQWLETQPDIRFTSDDTELTIYANDQSGFDIILGDEKELVSVYFDGWHEHFGTMEEALRCIHFGLSDKCRIKVDRRGSTPYQWTLEFRNCEGWKVESSTSLLFYPYWRPRKQTYLQNNHAINPQ